MRLNSQDGRRRLVAPTSGQNWVGQSNIPSTRILLLFAKYRHCIYCVQNTVVHTKVSCLYNKKRKIGISFKCANFEHITKLIKYSILNCKKMFTKFYIYIRFCNIFINKIVYLKVSKNNFTN